MNMKSTINSFKLLTRIIWEITNVNDKLTIFLVIIYSIFSSFLQYLSIVITAITFSNLTSNSFGGDQINVVGLKLELWNNSFFSIILIWLIISLISSLSVILATFFIYKKAYNIGKIISNNILKITIESNSIFHEKLSKKTLFNILTSENTMLIKGPIMAIISLPMQLSIMIALSSVILTYSNSFFIAIPILGLVYFTATNILLKSVRNNSVLVFDYRSQQTDLLTRLTENYLDIAFPPSNFNYRKLFNKITSKLRKLESFNVTIPRVLKSLLELILIFTIGLYIVYSLKIQNNSINYFISSSAAIIISIFKMAPVISGISSTFVTFDDQYESIKNHYAIFKNKLKYNLKSKNYNYSQVVFDSNYALKFNDISSKRIKKLNIDNSFSKNYINPNLIWIVGSSGCGKSTLFSMVAGIRPINNGSITLSLPISKKETHCLKHIFDLIAYMPQNPIFSSTTIREYIKDGDFKIDDQSIIEIIKRLKISNSFNIKPNQLLDLIVGPRGFSPSGGQAKLLAFARAICKRNVEIYLLDEPTSELSNELRENVLEYIYKLSEKKFVLSITHDLGGIRNFDEIIDFNTKKLSAIYTYFLFFLIFCMFYY